MLTEAFVEAVEGTFCHQSLDAFGEILLNACKHSRGTADANAVKHKGVDVVLFLNMVNPGRNIPAFGNSATVEVAFAFAVTTGVYYQNVKAKLAVGLCKIVGLKKAFGSAL